MKLFLVFLLFLSLQPVLSVSVEDPHYYVFALSRCSGTQTWGIHGLWPEWNSTSWPQFCKPHDYLDLDKIRPLVPLMEKYWYSCEGNNTAFWNHEWQKHGTCTNLDQYTYFSVALYLYEVLPWHLFCADPMTNCLVPLKDII